MASTQISTCRTDRSRVIGSGASRPRGSGRASVQPPRLSSRDDKVVDARDQIANQIAEHERVGEADQASKEAHSIADEELAQQGQVRADDGAPLEDEPVGGKEDAESRYQAGDDPLNG